MYRRNVHRRTDRKIFSRTADKVRRENFVFHRPNRGGRRM